MTLSGLEMTSWTREWLGPPSSAWQGKKVWAGKIHGEFSSRDTAGNESRVVEFEWAEVPASGLALGAEVLASLVWVSCHFYHAIP